MQSVYGGDIIGIIDSVAVTLRVRVHAVSV